MPSRTLARLRATVEHLASFDRPSASEGERRAAEWIRGELEALGVAGAGRGGAARSARWRSRSALLSAAGRAGGAGRAPRPRRSGCWRRRGSSTTSRGGPHVFRRAAPHRTTYNVVGHGRRPGRGGHARVRRPPRRRQRRADLPARADAARRRHVPGAGTSASRRSPQMLRLVAAGPALAGARRTDRCAACCASSARSCSRPAARSRSSTSPRAPSCRAPTTTSPPSPCVLELARLLRERAGRAACACCSSPPARRSRSWRACAAGCAATGPSLDPDAHPRRRARDARLAGADPARGRGDDLDDRLRRRACATSSPRPRSGAGVAAAPRAAARLRHRRAVGAARRAARPRRSPPATSTRCRPTTTRSATSRATSTTRRWRPAARVAEAAIRRAASARG